MKKKYFILILITLMIISFTACAKKEASDLPVAGVRLSHAVADNNVHSFTWRVTNNSEEDKVLTFKDGNIINYEIRHHQTNKKYISNLISVPTIVLKKGEKYETSIEIKDLDKGYYDAKFWAISEEGTNPTMIIHFDV